MKLLEKSLFIFDFDGVIADSVEMKTEAFALLYKEFGKEIVEKVVNHHISNGGVSRNQKFKYYHNQFLGIEIGDEELNSLCERFSLLVKDKVISSRDIQGSKFFLEYLNRENKICAINTGTPTEEIIDIISRRGISAYFKMVLGSPQSKVENLKEIILKFKKKKDEVIFFGDSTTDLEAAEELGLDFVGVGSEIKLFNTGYKNITYIQDFKEIQERITPRH